jgi:hypothetical protein
MRLVALYIATVLFGPVSATASPQAEPPKSTAQPETGTTMTQKKARTLQSSSGPKDSPLGVQVTGTISARVIRAGGRVSGSVTIANRSAADIDDVEVSARTPEGFKFIGGRLDTEGEAGDPCVLGAFGVPPAPAVRCRIPDKVRADEERAVTIEWTADDAEAEQGVGATVQWTQEGKQTPSKSYRDISLGEISSRSSWEFPFTEYPALLPLATGLLGGLIVAAVQSWLSFRAKRAEDERAEDAKIEEESRAGKARALEATREHTATTWEKMLPISHELAIRHYVHIQSFARSTVRQLELYEKESAAGAKETAESREMLERAFLSLTLFDRRMQYITETIGGAYFKNRMGEEIVGWSYFMYSRLYWDKNLKTRVHYSSFLRAIRPDARVSDLHELSSLAQGGARPKTSATSASDVAIEADACRVVVSDQTAAVCCEVRARFLEWVKNREWEQALPYLHAIRDVITFEMNRPYRYWYGGEAEKLSVSKIGRDGILKLGGGFMTGRDLEDFHAKLEAYLKESEAGSYES